MEIVSRRWCKYVVVAVLDVLLYVRRFTKQMDVGENGPTTVCNNKILWWHLSQTSQA